MKKCEKESYRGEKCISFFLSLFVHLLPQYRKWGMVPTGSLKKYILSLLLLIIIIRGRQAYMAYALSQPWVCIW